MVMMRYHHSLKECQYFSHILHLNIHLQILVASIRILLVMKPKHVLFLEIKGS